VECKTNISSTIAARYPRWERPLGTDLGREIEDKKEIKAKYLGIKNYN